MREDLLPQTFEGKLSRLVEECGETLQVIGKIQRFGNNPIDKVTQTRYHNFADLKSELTDLKHAIAQIEPEL
jgi:NTP pyrophosphatase (non-canonical NTP hydrolase)